ncbi:unnamed protein product [Somion occarium]|uniref:histone acetyltransferase n=1 Tax=Somion occarium TaxID=3059160 RepID=A0ABP1DY76_9APHY
MSVQSLRDALLASLSSLPGTRQFHIHVLVSSPRKHSGLFPYVHPRPRIYLQDILVLLSEQTTTDAPRVFVTAIEASVYNIPATSCGILYISKVDSSGQGIYPSPTATLVRSFLTYYADPATRPITVDTLWVQLFARAQGQYLFPNSSEFPGKRPLSDVKLCVWWKRLFTEVAEEAEGQLQSGSSGEKNGKIKLFYLLPGYSELEAQYSLKINSAAVQHPSRSIQWVYGHPYSQSDIPLPCPRAASQERHLGYCIPSFDDDPKSRFMDDLAHTTESNGVKSPKKKKPRTSLTKKPESTASTSEGVPPTRKAEHGEDNEEHHIRIGELDKVSPDEFWERMSFRQECISGAITGFFALGISTALSDRPPPSTSSTKPVSRSSSTPSPLAPQAGQVAARLVRRVVSTLLTCHEFSTTERAIRATETLEESIKGLCDNIASVPVTSKPEVSSTAHLLFFRDADESSTPVPDETPPEAGAGPSNLTYLDVPRTPPRRGGSLPDISPNPFPEPVASLDTYHSHIYGSVLVNNPPLPEKALTTGVGAAGKGEGDAGSRPVTVLAVRKKKRKSDA